MMVYNEMLYEFQGFHIPTQRVRTIVVIMVCVTSFRADMSAPQIINISMAAALPNCEALCNGVFLY